MKAGVFRRLMAVAAVGVLVHWGASASAAADADKSPVVVSFSDGETQIATVRKDEVFYIDRDFRYGPVSAEMGGLEFTRRRMSVRATAKVDAPAGAKVYLILGNGGAAAQARDAATALGFVKIDSPRLWLHGTQEGAPASLYSQTFAQPRQFSIEGGGLVGVVVLASHLTVKTEPKTNVPPRGQEVPQKRAEKPDDDTPIPGPVAPVKRLQSEIKALYVQEESSGEMLGLASELILTATPGSRPGHTPVHFVSAVGGQMNAVLDDVLRAIWLTTPKWAASKVELSFEDRYTPKDGGSIGAAIGTLIQSMLQGFAIDDKVAMTGDVTADSKLRRIGGVAAKIRGATAAECKIVIVPAANYDQVADAMIYEGRPLITNIQILGAANLDEATALARTDRAPKLKEAIDAFDLLIPVLKPSPEKVHLPEIQEKLKRITELAPNHFSARLLLLVAQNKQPRTLSAASPRHDPNYKRFVEFGVGTSRVGGMPDLPERVVWPEVGGKRLPFQCQFDLGELPRWEGKAMPDQGWLYAFGFVADDPQSCAVRVLYHAGPREALSEAERPEADEFVRDWMNESVYSRVPVCANVTLVVDTDLIAEKLRKVGIDPGSVQFLVAKTFPRSEGTGWVASLFEPVSAEDETASVLAGYRGETAGDWQNLITISSHGSMCWSDCGVLYLLIERGKLEAFDFSKVIPVIGSAG